MIWDDLSPYLQRLWAPLKGKVRPESIQEWWEALDRDAESYVQDVVAAFRETERATATPTTAARPP